MLSVSPAIYYDSRGQQFLIKMVKNANEDENYATPGVSLVVAVFKTSQG